MRDSGVAVIVPVYNRARVVLESLDSIARQTQPPAKLIVVDDGSTDATAESVAAWRQKFQPPFAAEILRQSNQGAAAARNAGLARARDASLVAFLDSDDLWPADFLARTVALLLAEPRAIAVSTDRLLQQASPRVSRLDSFVSLSKNPTRLFFENHGAVASTSLFRCVAVVRAGGFPPELRTGHDVVLFSRLSRQGRWLHAPGQPVIARQGLAATRGEATHICRHYGDYHRQWAEIWELLADEGRGELSPSLIKRVLSGRWRRAGRQLARSARWPEARACFLRSLVWRWNLKAAYHAWRCGWHERRHVSSGSRRAA